LSYVHVPKSGTVVILEAKFDQCPGPWHMHSCKSAKHLYGHFNFLRMLKTLGVGLNPNCETVVRQFQICTDASDVGQPSPPSRTRLSPVEKVMRSCCFPAALYDGCLLEG
jgi:hypothetical protein